MKLIEAIPNFSEGRDQKKIQAIVSAITETPGVFLLDCESDFSHNRSVVSFAGEPEAVLQASFAAVKKAAELIDLNRHQGEHPRMGATDVLPLVPLSEVTEEECIRYAKNLGKKIGTELKIPVYLYEKAATRPDRRNLAKIRQGEFEGIKKEIAKNPERTPDFGPKRMGSAGALALGVRGPLIAFNINLNTKNLAIAKSIAKKVRFSSGGLPYVKALGFELKDKGKVQVSMNLTDYKKTPVFAAFNAVKKEAKKHNVKIAESELVGLIPEDALYYTATHYLHLHGFQKSQVLEKVLQEKKASQTQQMRNKCSVAKEPAKQYPNRRTPTGKSAEADFAKERAVPSLEGFLEAVSSKSPTPGGGSVSALAGALAASLCCMVANLTIGKKKYETYESEMRKILKKSETLKTTLMRLMEKDAVAFQKVMKAMKAHTNVSDASKQASEIPLKIAETALKLLPLIKTLEKYGNRMASSDVGVAYHMLEACVRGALLNVEINLQSISDLKFCAKMKKKMKHILEQLKMLDK